MRLFDFVVVPPLWLFVCFKAPGLRSAPRQDRVMWTMWMIWAVAFGIGVPAVRRVIDAAVGLPSFTNLPVHMLSLCAMGALFEFIREATGTRGHRRAALRWILLGLAQAGLVVAFFASPLPDGETDLVTVTRSPTITVYWLIFLGYILYGVTSAIRLCWRYGRHASPGPSRTSMQLLGLACCSGLLYVVHRLVNLVAAFGGRELPGGTGVVASRRPCWPAPCCCSSRASAGRSSPRARSASGCAGRCGPSAPSGSCSRSPRPRSSSRSPGACARTPNWSGTAT
ncbi:hypothetical protein OG904_31935 [Streptomyces sp. NBC_00096]